MIEIKDKLLEGYTFIDLFAGIGGFRIALESLGAKCVFSSEIDKYAIETYKANFSEDNIYGDITKISEKDIPDCDIICGGFPCQPFSICGRKLGFEDTRGTLFFDIARIAREKKPKIMLLENVSNLKSHDEGKTFSIIANIIEEIGYDLFYKVLKASDYGVPQLRKRIYLVCFRKDLGIKDFYFPEPIKSNVCIADILEDEETVDLKLFLDMSREDITYTPKKKINPSIINTVGYIGEKRHQGCTFADPKGQGYTLTANGGGIFAKTGGYLINGKIRKLTERECARMMGFPEGFKIHPRPTQAKKQFGNSVVVNIIQEIGIEIGKALKRK